MFKVLIMDQERILYDGTASRVNLPGESGEFEVLVFHAPIIGLLRAGRIWVDWKSLPIRKGIAKMEKNELSILVER